MPRPVWKGAIAFGLVTGPVGLYSATERAERLSFHLLHKKDNGRIDYKRVCEKDDREVPWSEIVKGYEYAKGKYVVLTDEDFDKAKTPGTQTFDIRAFVDADEIDSLYFETPYYLAPTGKDTVKGYALLRDALEESGRVGVGTIVMREREHLAALGPSGDALMLVTMRFAHEIRSSKGLDLPKAHHGYQAKEMKLAHQLIDTLTSKWQPTEFKDTYTDVLKQLIHKKIEGEEIEAPEAPRRPKVVDLAKALEQSFREGRPPLARMRGGRSAARARRHRKAA